MLLKISFSLKDFNKFIHAESRSKSAVSAPYFMNLRRATNYPNVTGQGWGLNQVSSPVHYEDKQLSDHTYGQYQVSNDPSLAHFNQACEEIVLTNTQGENEESREGLGLNQQPNKLLVRQAWLGCCQD